MEADGAIYFQRDLLSTNLLLARSTFNEEIGGQRRDLLLTRSTFNEDIGNIVSGAWETGMAPPGQSLQKPEVWFLGSSRKAI